MKTPCATSRVLSSLVLACAITTTAPLAAQVSHSYTQPPPPGYPAPGAAARPVSTKAARQSAAAIQTPVTQYPSTYPPPPGYTYPPPPPGYGTSRKPLTSTTTTKKPVVKKPAAPTHAQPQAPSPTSDLARQVSKIRENDRLQNQRIGSLERDVSTIHRDPPGTGRSLPYDGGTDLAAHTTYISRPGDTLWRIATMHHVSVGEIQRLNRMTEEDVRVGQTLLIPGPRSYSSPPPSTTYTQVIYTPASAASREKSAPATMVKVSSPVYYTVKKGDSLKAIALKHKVTPVTLATANKIKDVNKIVVGQRLKIPGRTTTVLVPSKTTKTVVRREYADTIPLPGYGVPGSQLGMAPPPPAAGLAPQAPPPMAAAPSPPAAAPTTPKVPDTSDSHRGILAYRLDRTDTIESIATQFTTTPDQIRDMNRLAPGTTLKAGDEIMVPAMGAVSVSSR